MRNTTVNVLGLLLGSVGIVIASYLFAVEVCGEDDSKAKRFVQVTNLPHAKGTQENGLSPAVQMQFMRPSQLEAAARQFPVVYVPFGCIEWHGRHLPLGTDALKAHGILVKCAEKFGGVVYPPVYFHSGFNRDHLGPVITDLFQRLKASGFRVIMGVSGHNVQQQIDMINKATKHLSRWWQMAALRESGFGKYRSAGVLNRAPTMPPNGRHQI
jgi:hypothetical protein